MACAGYASRGMPTRRRPTIADVAREAGVSAAAVSFAVNDRPGVSPETRERILEVARELGWRPSASARALTEARTRAIGLVMGRDPEQLELDAFFVRFLSGIERTLAAADYALLLQLVPAGGSLAAHERLARGGRVDGFLLTDIELDDPRFGLLAAEGLPAVLAGRPTEPCPFPWVETRHAEGIDAAVAHLRELGHARIGFLGGAAEHEFVQARLARWRAEAGDGPVVLGGAPEPLLGDATAVVCATDRLALELVQAARAAGRDVPGDLSVTGFDDSPLAALAAPALTSVRVDYAEFGAAAAEALLAAIAGAPAPDYSASAPVLVRRASTGTARR
jgi:LacI family transcriptional regulator, repressor for deo operon, udp, cdd, tsx, nupC, and nupG